MYYVLGKNVLIKPNCVIGDTGFGFESEDGKYKIPLTRKEHNFKVIIQDNVEIGSGCVIDRGSWRDSIIGEGTKIDNMVHTGHNSVIGKNCLLAVGVTLGGSTTIGDNCFLGMNCCTKQGVKICDNVTIGMGAVVTKDITEPFTTWIGNPARQLMKQKKKEVTWLGQRKLIDFYQLYDNLPSQHLDLLKKVRTFAEKKVKPIVNEYWIKDEFPYQLIQEFKKLDICCLNNNLLTGLIVMELGRIDPSMATFYNIQNSLVIGSILEGSEEQRQKWIPQLAKFEKIGCFAMTEPLVGSGANDMQTTATRDGNDWILNGQKKWIGNSTWCDIAIIWAKVTIPYPAIKGFIVDTKSKGFKVEKIKNKFGLRICQNGLITLDNVRVSEDNLLRGVKYKDVLKNTRYLVACEATGLQMGAYELALKYAQERYQFGKPIASFQLIQDLLVKMLGNITACQCLVACLPDIMTDAQTSLAKAFCTAKMRETVAWGREIFGANGLSIDYNIGRFFTDAEALYSYEGSYQMQQLIVGKAITGVNAFV